MLIGREAELAEVESMIAAGRSVVVTGCLGVGRTAVAQAVAARHGVPVLSASASMSAIPFAAVAAHAVGDDPTARLASVAAWMTSMPLVVVDDAHLLDAQTAIACRLAAQQVPVVATVLEHVPADDAITALWRDGGLRRTLAPLPESDAGRLLAVMIGHEPDPWTRLHASRLSGGLPAAIEAVAATVTEAAVRVPSGPSGRSVVAADTAPSSSLTERCRAALPPTVLDALALLGVVYDCADHEFERSFGRGALAACGALVGIDESGRVRPRSTLVAAAAVDAVPAARLAELLAGLDASFLGPLGRVAVADARRDPIVPDDLLAAAIDAARAHDAALALRLLDRADAAEPTDRLITIARVGALLDRPDMVETAATMAAGKTMRPGQRAGLAALVATVEARRPNATRHTVLAAIDRLDTDPAAAAEVEAQRIAVLYELGRFDEAAARRRALGEATGRAQRMQTYLAEAMYRMAFGDTVWVREQAITHLAAGMSLGPEAVRPVVAALLVALIFEFQFEEAERMLELGELTLGRSNPEQRVLMFAARAALETNRGRTRLAEQVVLEATALARGARLYDLLPILGSLGVHSAVAGGHTERLAEHLALARLPSTTMPGASTLLNPGIEGAAAIGRGDRKAAIAHVMAAAQEARTLGLPGAEVFQLSNAVRFGATTGLRSQRVAKLRTGFSSPVLRVLADRVIATERGDPLGLIEVAEFFGARGNALEAAEASLQAAAVARQTGRDDLAAEYDLRALEWERQLDRVATPLMVLLRGGGGRFQLTPRERDVVDLAQQGLSNREIADRTFTSVRTVEGHLMRAYAKLGIDGRDGLRGRDR